VLLTVLAIWLGLAVPAAVFVAALGRSALREDQALGHLPTCADAPAGVTAAPLVPVGRWEHAALHDG
jgi:hypothetical protein